MLEQAEEDVLTFCAFPPGHLAQDPLDE